MKLQSNIFLSVNRSYHLSSFSRHSCTMTMLLLHFCLLALLQVHPSHSLVSSRLKPRFQFGNTNVKPGFPSISANSHIPLGDNTNLNLNGKYNYVSNNFQGGAGFNHQSGRNNYGLGANYNSANGGVNIGANANIHNNLQAGVGYNTANHGVDAGLNWRFGRRSAPKMQRFSHPEVPAVQCIYRSIKLL